MIINTNAKHALINLEDDDTAIFRLIEVHHLFELFESKSICLVKPKLWEDPYENFFNFSYGIDPLRPNSRIKYDGHTKLLFGQCWTLNEDNDATWRIYSPKENKVKIKTTVNKLYNFIKRINQKWFRSYIGKVIYQPGSNIEKNIEKAIRTHSVYAEDLVKNFYLVKRDTFLHEKEIRLLVDLPAPGERVINADYQDPDNLNLCYLPIENPLNLIDEIVFDPRMPNSVVQAYSNHLKETFGFKAPCYKSTIYEVPQIKVKVDTGFFV